MRGGAGDAMPNTASCAWMERSGLSLTAAAQALGLTRNTVKWCNVGGAELRSDRAVIAQRGKAGGAGSVAELISAIVSRVG